MRVIAGAAKGHNLQTIEGLETRPTTDRIKETLFNIIAFDLPECSFLDLFSGSGAIGIEALSRGAKEAVFVDAAAECQKVITANLQHTKLQDRARLMKTDVFSALDKLAAEGKKFDIIFMDPPYAAGLYEPVLEKIMEKGLLKEEGYLITEGSSQIPLTPPAGMKILREKVYKTTILTFLCLEEEVV
ncbi:16S rRNA (guanine(966)-N(2))-methyltransferase RsmD [Anaerotignum sp.]|nr:16S rRNA (guanine(966)-N(2))-methyltransferase RsmD [Anaerotignum sp.]MBQ7759112.1 16S rRNA (guanine(966)-N(2))-methyltransferase RsmD [Anaerotignum sp.]